MVTKTQVVGFLSKKSVLVTVSSAISLGVGGYTGFELAKRKLKPYYEEIAEREIARAKEHYGTVLKLDDMAKSPEEMVRDKYGDVVDKLGYLEKEAGEVENPDGKDIPEPVVKRTREGTPYLDYSAMSQREPKNDVSTLSDPDQPSEPAETPTKEDVMKADEEAEPERRTRNVFADNQPIRDDMDWDWVKVMERRAERPYDPYVITHEEFLENEHEWLQEELTYYEGDDILAEEGDQIIFDTDKHVGNENLTCFGLQSDDPNVVYVRDEGREIEYEITKDPRKFTVVVHGLPDIDDEEETSMRHTDRRGVTKMRMHDG